MPKARPQVSFEEPIEVSFADILEAHRPRAGKQLKILQVIAAVRAIKPEVAEQIEAAIASGKYSSRWLCDAINSTLAAFDIAETISEGSVTKHPSYVALGMGTSWLGERAATKRTGRNRSGPTDAGLCVTGVRDGRNTHHGEAQG